MKQSIKRFVKRLFPLLRMDRYISAAKFCRTIRKQRLLAPIDMKALAIDTLRVLCSDTFIDFPRRKAPVLQYAVQFRRIVRKISFKRIGFDTYLYPLDEKIHRVIPYTRSTIASLTPDYEEVLRLQKKQVLRLLGDKNDEFAQAIRSLLDSICLLQQRSVDFLDRIGSPRAVQISGYIKSLLDQKPESLDEALQKILFFNALLWQCGHRHNGLGRLDKILYPYYRKDLEERRINREKAKGMLEKFVLVLGKNTQFKSGVLIGDTGQVILIGGSTAKENQTEQIENDLTHMFLEIITELNVPDPKLILRINEHTSDQLWQAAVRCMARGNGSPLMANERVIMERMVGFGYAREDCYEFGTSACWEPLIIGKSFDQNNSCENIVPVKPLAALLDSSLSWNSFEELLNTYTEKLQEYTASITADNRVKTFDIASLLSLYTPECLRRGKDISEGGAVYNYHGYLVCGLPNTVNALLNLREIVFDRRLLTLEQVKRILASDYCDEPDLPDMLRMQPRKFGETSETVLELTNRLMRTVSEVVEQSSINGERAKVGFSSPGYVSAGQKIGATFDGRKAGEPLGVHISPVSREIDMAEVLRFAARLDYSGSRINGNVVDFIVPEVYIKNSDKFTDVLKGSFQEGVYELQMNVLDAEKLIAAKNDPTLYPQLVVRVWGFSAYYNDLPEEYKDQLIRRAQMYA